MMGSFETQAPVSICFTNKEMLRQQQGCHKLDCSRGVRLQIGSLQDVGGAFGLNADNSCIGISCNAALEAICAPAAQDTDA